MSRNLTISLFVALALAIGAPFVSSSCSSAEKKLVGEKLNCDKEKDDSHLDLDRKTALCCMKYMTPEGSSSSKDVVCKPALETHSLHSKQEQKRYWLQYCASQKLMNLNRCLDYIQ